jgi:hypothetical protein
VEFVGGRVEGGHSQGLAGGRPSPGPRAAGAILSNVAAWLTIAKPDVEKAKYRWQ